MLEKIKTLFSGKKQQSAPAQNAENIQPAEFNAADRENFINNIANNRKARLEEERAAKMEKIFPRSIKDLVPVDKSGGSYAMDAGLECGVCPPIGKTGAPSAEVLDRFDDFFIGWNSCAILKQNWLIDRAITIPAQDAIAPGFTLALADTDDVDTDNDGEISADEQQEREKLLKDCESAIDEFDIKTICAKAEETMKTFGYCLVIPAVDGADMSKPFNPDGIRKGSYKGLTVIEPMWIVPTFGEDGYDPGSANFYKPEFYNIAGLAKRKIHRSWCVKLINSEVPDILKPAYFFGGVSLPQQIYKRVYCAETVANEAPQLALTKRLLSVEGEVINAIANPEQFRQHMEMFTELRDNYGVAMTERGSNLRQIDTSLTDFDQLIMTQYQLVASIAQMPVTKLLKVQVKGFDSAGTYEMDDYIQKLVSIQNTDYNRIIDLHNQCFTASAFGKEIKLSVNWNDIDVPGAKESAEIRLLNAQRDNTLIAAGIISPDEAREHLRSDEDSGYTTLADIEEETGFDDDFDGENA